MATDIDWRTTRIGKPSPAIERVEKAYCRVLEEAGLELDYGAKLPELLESHGLKDVGGEAFIRYSRGDTIGPHVYRLSIERLRKEIVAGGLASDSDVEEMKALLLDPADGSFSPTIWTAWGRRSRA